MAVGCLARVERIVERTAGRQSWGSCGLPKMNAAPDTRSGSGLPDAQLGAIVLLWHYGLPMSMRECVHKVWAAQNVRNRPHRSRAEEVEVLEESRARSVLEMETNLKYGRHVLVAGTGCPDSCHS